MSMQHCLRTYNASSTLPPSIMTELRGLRGLVVLLARDGLLGAGGGSARKDLEKHGERAGVTRKP